MALHKQDACLWHPLPAATALDTFRNGSAQRCLVRRTRCPRPRTVLRVFACQLSLAVAASACKLSSGVRGGWHVGCALGCCAARSERTARSCLLDFQSSSRSACCSREREAVRPPRGLRRSRASGFWTLCKRPGWSGQAAAQASLVWLLASFSAVPRLATVTYTLWTQLSGPAHETRRSSTALTTRSGRGVSNGAQLGLPARCAIALAVAHLAQLTLRVEAAAGQARDGLGSTAQHPAQQQTEGAESCEHARQHSKAHAAGRCAEAPPAQSTPCSFSLA